MKDQIEKNLSSVFKRTVNPAIDTRPILITSVDSKVLRHLNYYRKHGVGLKDSNLSKCNATSELQNLRDNK
jgi:hypothetical protein